MTSTADGVGFIPPQQARSRAALERLLAAAREVLADRGPEEFTIAAVAERAGVSVGGVYRRFTGKEQLLEAVVDSALRELQATITAGLADAPPDLAGVVGAFARALADYFTRVGPVYVAIIGAGNRSGDPERGLAVVAAVQRLFLDAALPHSAEIAHRAPATALSTVLRTMLAAGVHRAAVSPWWPDGLTWEQWAGEIAAMATAYLQTPGPG